jgi:hypothetical protein
VDRALSIIETLAEDDEGYRLSDLAIRTGLSASTVHRLLATLESRRFVQFDRDQSKWHVGARAFTVGATFVRRRNFTAQAIPYLRKLRDLTRETAQRSPICARLMPCRQMMALTSSSEAIGRIVREVAAELTAALGGVMPGPHQGLGNASGEGGRAPALPDQRSLFEQLVCRQWGKHNEIGSQAGHGEHQKSNSYTEAEVKWRSPLAGIPD